MNKKHTKKALDWFELRIASTKKELKELRKAIKLLEKGKCHYRIQLHSMWEAEENVRYDAEPGETLNKAAKVAEAKFMELNNRSDVQAFKYAHLIMDNGQYVYVKHPFRGPRQQADEQESIKRSRKKK